MRWTLKLTIAALAMSLGLGAADAAASPVDLRFTRITADAVYGRLRPGGSEVRLTLDPALQRAAERLLASAAPHEGAIVASDPRTGRILAWATRGGRDFVSEAFAPSASLFKIVTASALLESGKATRATRECYEGGEHEVRPADLDKRGSVCTTMGEALGHSVNLVFARLAKKHLTPEDLRKYASALGYSGAVPIDVDVAASVVTIPDDPFGMARASAGFWNGRLSPLGALFAMQTIANDGERVRLSLLDHGGVRPRISDGRAVSVSTARSLERMLEITTRRGTAAKAFRHGDGSQALPGISVAGKTGTLIGGKPTRMYSWFAAFAPATRPEIAISVMLGNDLRWRAKANFVGRELLEVYFAADPAKHAAPAGARRRATTALPVDPTR